MDQTLVDVGILADVPALELNAVSDVFDTDGPEGLRRMAVETPEKVNLAFSGLDRIGLYMVRDGDLMGAVLTSRSMEILKNVADEYGIVLTPPYQTV